MSTYKKSNYINKESKEIYKSLTTNKMNAIVIGNGDIIINQYPPSNTIMNIGNKIYLLTNDDKYIMPDITGWSRSEVNTFCNLIGLKVEYSGYGYAKTYSIKKGVKIDLKDTLEVTLESKFN